MASQKSWLKYSLLTLLFLGSLSYLVENNTKTLYFKEPKVYNYSRDEVMFTKKGYHQAKEHLQMVEIIIKQQADTVGLILNGDGFDYPIWHMIKREHPNIHIEHILVSIHATPQKIIEKNPVITPDVIISTENNHADTIHVNERRYLNIKKLSSMDIYQRQ